jgi:5-formyltetrahydrofolate cyclo-ligase
MFKQDLRQVLKESRRKVSSEASVAAGNRLIPYLTNYERYLNWLLYAPIQSEISTKPLFDWLESKGRKVFFPKVFEDRLRFFQVRALNELSGTPIPEPSDAAEEFCDSSGIILVPGLGFSTTGHRLGFGKGFYDRYLASAPQLLRIGLAYEFQIILKPWPPETHDQTLHFTVTPSGVWGQNPFEFPP